MNNVIPIVVMLLKDERMSQSEPFDFAPPTMAAFMCF